MSWRTRTSDPQILSIVFRLQDKFPQDSFSNVTIIYPSIGSGGTLDIPGGERVIAKRAIQKTPFTRDGFYMQLPVFFVPKKGGSMRPLIDLSSLNKFIVNEQMENLSCLKTLLLRRNFMPNNTATVNTRF